MKSSKILAVNNIHENTKFFLDQKLLHKMSTGYKFTTVCHYFEFYPPTKRYTEKTKNTKLKIT